MTRCVRFNLQLTTSLSLVQKVIEAWKIIQMQTFHINNSCLWPEKKIRKIMRCISEVQINYFYFGNFHDEGFSKISKCKKEIWKILPKVWKLINFSKIIFKQKDMQNCLISSLNWQNLIFNRWIFLFEDILINTKAKSNITSLSLYKCGDTEINDWKNNPQQLINILKVISQPTFKDSLRQL